MFKILKNYTLQDFEGLSLAECEEYLMYFRYLSKQDIDPQSKENYEIFKVFLETRIKHLKNRIDK